MNESRSQRLRHPTRHQWASFYDNFMHFILNTIRYNMCETIAHRSPHQQVAAILFGLCFRFLLCACDLIWYVYDLICLRGRNENKFREKKNVVVLNCCNYGIGNLFAHLSTIASKYLHFCFKRLSRKQSFWKLIFCYCLFGERCK